MEKVLHFEQIRELLPYSSPFLLVDKITDWISNEKIIGKKVISGSDPLIYSHFKSGMVLVPGVILIELVGQAGLLLSILSSTHTNRDNTIDNSENVVLAKCKADFYGTIRVGDTIDIVVVKEAEIQNKIITKGELFVDNILKCKVEIYSAKI